MYMRTITHIESDWIDDIVPNFSQTKKLFNTSTNANVQMK